MFQPDLEGVAMRLDEVDPIRSGISEPIQASPKFAGSTSDHGDKMHKLGIEEDGFWPGKLSGSKNPLIAPLKLHLLPKARV